MDARQYRGGGVTMMNIVLKDAVNGNQSLNFGLKNHKKSAYVIVKAEIKNSDECIEFLIDRNALLKTMEAMTR